jgi:hypothetical protein
MPSVSDEVTRSSMAFCSGIAGIQIEDDSIAWTAEGPDLPLGAGTIQGELGLVPTRSRKPGEAVPPVVDFLTGFLMHGGITPETN